jgi:hypothetical protein
MGCDVRQKSAETVRDAKGVGGEGLGKVSRGCPWIRGWCGNRATGVEG